MFESAPKTLLSSVVTLGSLCALAVPVVITTVPAIAAGTEQGTASTARSGSEPSAARALAAADAAADLELGALSAGKREELVRAGSTTGGEDLHYVRYQRTYRGLPVVGGDAIVTVDETGTVLDTVAGGPATVSLTSTRPTVSSGAAMRTARRQLTKVTGAKPAQLVVSLADGGPRLAWHAFVEGSRKDGTPSVLNVYVDARDGRVISTEDLVRDATGNGHHNGTVQISTSGSGGSYSMTSPTVPGLKCGGQNGAVYTDADNVWGNGSGTDLVTACVDAMYAGEQEHKMLGAWAGRSGINGNGNGFPSRVGLTDVNAYWNGSYANFGRNQAGTKQATPMDVVAHEYGHGVFQFSGGSGGSGNEAGGLNESTGDIVGAATEFYASNTSDPADYEVGEEVDLVGQGPIRYMHDPSKAGDPNCYSSSIPNTEVHAAAGPQNHWFYLLAEGNKPANGMPESPICSGGPASITGIGIQKATNIFVNGLQQKTSPWTHAKARVATLKAAKTLYPTSCVEFNAVKSAWLGVNVPAQAGEPTCESTSNDFSVSLDPASGSVAPGSSITTTVKTATTQGNAQSVTLSAAGLPAGATAVFSPTSVTSGGTATMTIRTSTSTPVGPATITVTGTGSVTHTAPFNLTVGEDTTPDPGAAPDVDVEAVKADLQKFQDIANSNGGNRRAGSAGYTASVSYVETKLKAAGFTVVRQRCTTCTYPSDNLIADWPGGDVNNTIMFGAHLDGVGSGPGINDNGSGSAAILQAALAVAAKAPTMEGHLRFAWWTDEEQGLNGSEYYVNNLTSTQRAQIKSYYNFDMVGSTNGGYFINNINSTSGSVLKSYYAGLDIAAEENTEGAGRSDDYPFQQAGIPTSGVAAGASARKTSAQASKWGGTAGAAYDPCYHSSCDKYPANINTTILDRAADAIAHTAWVRTVGEVPDTTDDYSVSLSPGAGTVQAGGAVSTTVTSQRTKGDDQTVSLSATGLPAGATATFTPTSVTTGGSSTLKIQTSASTPAGVHPVTVRATAASGTKSLTYSLTVTGDDTGGGATTGNGTDYVLYDRSTIASPATTDYASSVSSVSVKWDVRHSCNEDLSVRLLAPDGKSYLLQNYSYGSCTAVDGFITKEIAVDPTVAAGTWRLQVTDHFSYDQGRLYSWSITFP